MNKSILAKFPWMENRQFPQNWDLATSVVWEFRKQTIGIVPLNNTTDKWKLFNKWYILDNYDSLIIMEGKIATIFSSKWPERLSVWDFIQLKWDSKGYIGSGHGSWEWVTITGFVEPFQWGHSTNIIQVVASDGQKWFVKPKNIITDTKKNYIRESLEWYNQNYIRWKNKEIDDLFDTLYTICIPYDCWITENWVLAINPQMPDELKNQTRILAQRIVIAMQS